MTEPGAGSRRWIAVIGERTGTHEPQEAIEPAIGHAAACLGLPAPEVRWVATDRLEADGTDVLAGAAGVWCAPGSPYRSLDGAVEGIRWAREGGVAFIGTCAGFQHGVIEYARHVLGHEHAAHAEYGTAEGDELFIDELLCSLVGQTMHVEVVDDEVQAMYGDREPVERYYCRFGLKQDWADALDGAGLRVAGVDRADGDTRIMRAEQHPFHLLTLFVPQTASSPTDPHPLIVAYLEAVCGG